MKGCKLKGARFRGAEIERAMLTPDQAREADLRGVEIEAAPSI
jgi:uncharacterized protein YjbI with pentapeptide repeats